MSGSFWKFGHDYGNEAPLTKLLNKAFFRVDALSGVTEENVDSASEGDRHTVDKTGAKEETEDLEVDHSQSDVAAEEVSISESNFEYKDYRPNLDILDDLLDDEELYTELMCSNFKLLVFFRYPEVLSKLVDYVTNEHVLEQYDEYENENIGDESDSEFEEEEGLEHNLPSVTVSGVPEDDTSEDKEEEGEIYQKQSQLLDSFPDTSSESSAETSITLPPENEEQVESRRARIAAEILSADVWTISSAFMDNEDLLLKLWSILAHSTPLSIIASTYFMKINERLLDMDINGMINFILTQENIVDRFMAHIDNPPLMDFLLKVISTDKADAPTGIIALLKDQHLIPRLLDYLSSDYDSSIQSAAGDFLKALITISANSNNEIASAIGPNELTRELVSKEMVTKLVDVMLQGGTSLSNGVGIVIELIRKNNSDYDFVQVMYTTLQTHPPSDRDPVYLGHLVRCFAGRMADFNKILVETKLPPLETPFGTIEPLGFERFKICELVAELLHCSNMGLLGERAGEEIVRERDIKREELIKLSQLQHEENELPVSELESKMQDLLLEPKNGSNEVLAVEEQQEVEGDTDIHSENSSDSEATEKTLRENPVVGDLLKISLQDNNVTTTILDMFFRFPWNNFLHNVVFDIVQQIFNGPLKTGYNRFLLADLFSVAQITDIIMEGDKKCSDYEKETGVRLGYMGHLTLIAEEVAKFAAYVDEASIMFSTSVIQSGLNEPKWREYCDTVLTETREKYSSLLGEDGINENDEEVNNEIFGDDDDGVDENIDQDYGSEHANFNSNESVHIGSNLEEENCFMYEDGHGNNTQIRVRQDDGLSGIDDDEDEDDEDDDDRRGNGDVNFNENYTEFNKFSSYMSDQLSGNRNMNNHEADEDGDDSDNESETNKNGQSRPDPFKPQFPGKTFFGSNSMFQSHQFDLSPDDDEDYLDPNDDGQSYARPNHPLYSSMLGPNNQTRQSEDEDDEEEEDSNGEDDEIEDIEQENLNSLDMGGEENNNTRAEEYSLHRTSSKDNIAWDPSDQNTIIGMASLQRTNSHETN